MAKQPESTESRLRKRIKDLTGEIALHKALTLDKYPDPMAIDVKAALAETTQKTRFGQPFIEAWTINSFHGVGREIVTSSTTKAAYVTECEALRAWRNWLARDTAKALLRADRRIDEAQGHAIEAPSNIPSEETTYDNR